MAAAGGGDAEAEEASAFGHAPVPADVCLPYGPHPDQVVDLYAPRGGTGPAPLVVLLHGGAWRAPYDRHHVSPLAARLAGYGFAVASVEYRRGPGPTDRGSRTDGAPGEDISVTDDLPAPGESGTGNGNGSTGAAQAGSPPGAVPRAGRWPETFDDVALAVDRLPALIGRVQAGEGRSAVRGIPQGDPAWARVDPACTVLTGHSAGGHLALWAAARHRLPVGSRWHCAGPPGTGGCSPPPFRGVVALAPIADFTTARRLGVCSDAAVQLLGGPEEWPARLPYADNAALLPTGVRTTVVQGATDADVPPDVARAFVAAAERAGQPVRLVLLDGVGHFPLIDPAAPAVAVVADEIARLAGREPGRDSCPGPGPGRDRDSEPGRHSGREPAHQPGSEPGH
ncbi:alpha/beta hydrolase [Streptomyces sp. bgisy100]|uniref:alpha/beta hydrolase n=1 Tax=Streptomyces sp. bgisy100 TaxID=3413783 RepID=UPI003D7344AD